MPRLSPSRALPAGLLAAALLLVPAALPAAGLGGFGVDTSDFGFTLPRLSADEDIQIAADRMGADQETQRATLDGNVRIRFADLTLTSDRASYNRATGDLYAEGNVRIVSAAGGVWEGDSIAFNHRTGEGLMGTGLLRLGSFAVDAPGGASRDDDGILHARNATLTTCTNASPHSWHWSVTGTGRYKDSEFIELRDATFRLFGLPLLWAPYYYRDLNTHYGWRILPGYSSDWGAYLRLGYVYPLAGNRESDRELYGKTILDLRSERGVGAGQELTWRTEGILGEGTRQWGRLTLYYAYDTDDQNAEDLNWNSAYDENRWSIGFRERLDLSPRDFISITGEKVSDSQFREDYDELAVRASSQPLGIANYEHRENAWVASLALMGPLDTFYAGVRHLPELRLDTLPRPVLLPHLFYESQTSLGWLRRQPAKYGSTHSLRYSYQPGNWAYYDTLRFDTRHILRRPIRLADGVTFTPRLGWRGTYYADGPDDALFRSLFEIGATLQARFWRDYDTFRHAITPYLDLTYVPAARQDALDQPYAFDRLDQEYEWRDRFVTDGLTPTHRYAGLRFGLRNALQRRNPATNTLSDFLSADLYGVWVFQTEDHWVRWTHRQQPGRDNISRPATRVKEETGLRLLGLNATFKPRSNIVLSADVQYDPENSTFALLDLNAGLRLKAVTLYAGYLRRNHALYDYYWSDSLRDSILYGGFVHHLCDTIDWSAYARYNLEWSDLEEVGGYLQYNLDCLSFRLALGYLPKYYSEDGWKHGSDFRISLGAWIRAFPKDDEEDWMTWGNLTNEHALQDPET